VPEFVHPAWLLLIVLMLLLVGWSLRRERGLRQVSAGVLRALGLVALVIALAGPLAGSSSRFTDVVFALDLSSSITRESVAEALDFVNRARESQARIGLVVFGADAAVESAVRAGSEPVNEITAQIDRSGTDIGRAIEVAIGAFGSAAQRRIVMLTDGQENLGDARAAAAVARSLGVEIDTLVLERSVLKTEVHLQSVAVPSRVRVQEPFKVQVTVHSTAPARGHLAVLRNGAMLRESAVELASGANVYSYVEQADAPGLLEYTAVINSDADSEQENNS